MRVDLEGPSFGVNKVKLSIGELNPSMSSLPGMSRERPRVGSEAACTYILTMREAGLAIGVP